MHDAYELIRTDNNTGKSKLVKEVGLNNLDKLRKIKNRKVNKLRKKGAIVQNEGRIY